MNMGLIEWDQDLMDSFDVRDFENFDKDTTADFAGTGGFDEFNMPFDDGTFEMDTENYYYGGSLETQIANMMYDKIMEHHMNKE